MHQSSLYWRANPYSLFETEFDHNDYKKIENATEKLMQNSCGLFLLAKLMMSLVEALPTYSIE